MAIKRRGLNETIDPERENNTPGGGRKERKKIHWIKRTSPKVVPKSRSGIFFFLPGLLLVFLFFFRKERNYGNWPCARAASAQLDHPFGVPSGSNGEVLWAQSNAGAGPGRNAAAGDNLSLGMLTSLFVSQLRSFSFVPFSGRKGGMPYKMERLKQFSKTLRRIKRLTHD